MVQRKNGTTSGMEHRSDEHHNHEHHNDEHCSDEHCSDTTGPAPQAILETVVYCECLSAARDFYENVVGLTVVSVEPGRHVFFRVGHGMLLVFNPTETDSGTVLIGDQMIPRHGTSGASHFAFEILPQQVKLVRENLVSRNIPVEAEIEWPTGGYSLYCRDPAGNSVEFATRELWFEQ